MENISEKILIQDAIEFFKKGDYQESLRIWRFLVISSPNNALFYFNFSNTHFEMKNYKAAIHGYKRVLLLKSPLTPAARLFLGKSYAYLGDKEMAIAEFKKLQRASIPIGIRSEAKKSLIEIDPKTREEAMVNKEKKLLAPLDFPIGLSYFKRQNYPLALVHLEKAVETYKESEVYLIKGICYYKLNKFEQAKKDLNIAIKTTNDPDIRRNSNALLALMKKQVEEKINLKKKLFFYGDLSSNFNSNPLSLSSVDNDTKSSQVILFGEIGYHFIQKEKFNFDMSYEINFEESLKTSKERFVEHTISMATILNNKKSYLELLPKYVYQEVGKRAYVEKIGGQLSFTSYFDGGHRFLSEYQYLSNSQKLKNANYLNGDAQYLRNGWGYRGDRFDLSVRGTISRDRFKDEESNVLSNNGYGVTGSLILYPVEEFSINTSLNYLVKEYLKDPNSSFKRKDKSTSLSFGISYNMKSGIGVYLNTNLSFVDSNLEDSLAPENILATDEIFDFQETVSIGVTWSY